MSMWFKRFSILPHLTVEKRHKIFGSLNVRYSSNNSKIGIDSIRNIGVLAHIDAGKTTTTERMLYYSGIIHTMGEVHNGNTVTDYLEQERNRGITITSACVTFPWSEHRINLVDTPGHIDFTMEVEQALSVTDGAIIVLDSSAGVEAQTITVWRQAQNYSIPCIVFANKMDRPDSSLELCIKTLSEKLRITAIPLQIPIVEKKKLTGIVDVIELKVLKWCGDDGVTVAEKPLTEADGSLWERAKSSRENLTSTLADLDDTIANSVITSESLNDILNDQLLAALRRVTIQKKAVPVLCGSAYKNIGVQKLMDAVVQYLPSPLDRPDRDIHDHFQNNLFARVFKITHDKVKGPIAFCRIFSGKLEKSQKIFNVRQESAETISRLMVPYADNFEEVHRIDAGNVAAIIGLKGTMSGDNMVSNLRFVEEVSRKIAETEKISEREAYKLLGGNVEIPDPVFFCTIEPPSLAYQNAFDTALDNLKREDRGLRISIDPDTGQTVLGGMGELHLEIIKDRIRTEYNIEADVGPLQIAYREALLSSAKESHSSSVKLGKYANNITLIMSAHISKSNEKLLKLDRSHDTAANVGAITQKHLQAIQTGIESAITRGPKVGCPVVNAKFTLHWFEGNRATPESVVSSATSQCVQKLLQAAGTQLLEPIMNVEIVTDATKMSAIMADLGRRNVSILNIFERGGNMVILLNAPLAHLLGFSTSLRTVSSGTAFFTMEFHSFQPVDAHHEGEAIKNITGFYP